MGIDYSEQDTERARQAEHSSAGRPTQQLAPPPAAGVPPVTPARRTNNLAALALIVVGVLMLMGRVMPGQGDATGGMVLLTIASCFLFFAFWRRIYGLLIPGCILAGLSIGVTFEAVTGGVSVLWGLALGFLAIYLVGRALFNHVHPWPVIPAVIMFAVGLITAMENMPLFTGGMVWLPLLLIGAGLYLGWVRKA